MQTRSVATRVVDGHAGGEAEGDAGNAAHGPEQDGLGEHDLQHVELLEPDGTQDAGLLAALDGAHERDAEDAHTGDQQRASTSEMVTSAVVAAETAGSDATVRTAGNASVVLSFIALLIG